MSSSSCFGVERNSVGKDSLSLGRAQECIGQPHPVRALATQPQGLRGVLHWRVGAAVEPSARMAAAS